MRILERYIVRDYIAAFFMCAALLVVLGIIGDILGFLDDIFKNNIPIKSILAFYLYLAPFALVNMVPFACLLSGVYVFNSLSKNHEMTAIITSGLSLWKLVKPVVFATVVLCLATFIVNDKLVPVTMEKANSIRHNELETSSSKGGEIKNIAVYGGGDQMIFAKGYRPGPKVLDNVIIHKHDNDRVITEKISARLVKWSHNEWVGEDVLTFKLTPDGDFIGDPISEKRAVISIREKPKDFVMNQWDPKYMSFKGLEKYIEAFKGRSPVTAIRLKVDLFNKLTFPFTALVLVLVGIPFSIETGRANALVGMARGMTVAMLYLPVMALSIALGKGGVLSPWVSVSISQIIFVGIGAYYINRKS
ncbi:MAG: LptF/LptG family permease [Candidatus Omnitrophica bacterium]|nr:LptF/LptG family permease [Candidatus Omnitrophota bacterium]